MFLNASYEDLFSMLDMLHSGTVPHEGQQVVDVFGPQIYARKVAFITDIPYSSSGADTTSGSALSPGSVEVYHKYKT